jgi:glyoxylase-like metal-dependent hydrolase (beta-lactamase superfamily II)
VDSFLSEGDKVRWGKYEVSVLHTPGHTKGSISLYLPFELLDSSVPAADARKKSHALAHSPILFAGDTLFAGSIGRTDLWGGSTPQILSSIHHKILSLPDDTVVYPGHGPATTIGDERESNPFLTR